MAVVVLLFGAAACEDTTGPGTEVSQLQVELWAELPTPFSSVSAETLAPTPDGGAWLLVQEELWHIDPDGSARRVGGSETGMSSPPRTLVVTPAGQVRIAGGSEMAVLGIEGWVAEDFGDELPGPIVELEVGTTGDLLAAVDSGEEGELLWWRGSDEWRKFPPVEMQGDRVLGIEAADDGGFWAVTTTPEDGTWLSLRFQPGGENATAHLPALDRRLRAPSALALRASGPIVAFGTSKANPLGGGIQFLGADWTVVRTLFPGSTRRLSNDVRDAAWDGSRLWFVTGPASTDPSCGRCASGVGMWDGVGRMAVADDSSAELLEGADLVTVGARDGVALVYDGRTGRVLRVRR